MLYQHVVMRFLCHAFLLASVIFSAPSFARENGARDRADREVRREARAEARELRIEERLRLREERLEQAVRNGELSSDDANELRRKQRDRMIRRQGQDDSESSDDSSSPWRRRFLAP